MPKISVIIPAYNEELSVGKIVKKTKYVLKDIDHEIIVIDDGSQDNTAKTALENGAEVIKHPYNIGNGASVKSGLRKVSGDIIILMDADGQHSPEDIPRLLEKSPEYDMAIGARKKWNGILLHRKIANALYNIFASYLISRKVEDLTSGFRAIKADIAKKFIYLLPNTFSYPTTLTMALSKSGYSISYVPIETRKRKGKSKINLLSDGVRFLLIMMKISVFFNPLRIFLPVSILFFFIGIGHAFMKIFIFKGHYTGFSLFFITIGITVFLLGLVGEQIALMRLERSER